MLHILIWEDLTDARYIAAHTEGFAALKATVRDYTPKFVAELCGIAESDLLQAARWFGESPAALSLYCQGLNQSTTGTAKNAALINLHLATGQIGKPGAGPFSLTGQPNAMGGAEVGGMANLLSAHRDLGNPVHRAEVAALWGVDAVPATPGKTAVEMFEAAAQRRDQGRCGSPAPTRRSRCPTRRWCARALERAEFVVVQEAFANTATCAYADVLLPATTWGEKGRHRHQHRAPHQPRARGRGGAGRGARRLGDRGRFRAPPRSAIILGALHGERRCSLTPRPSRSGTSTANRRAAATSISPA